MHAYGYCNSHAHRFRAFGDPLECRATRGPSPFERFDAKVQRTATCWLWIGATNQKGYGTFWSGDVRTGAHRWSYEYHVGPIPVGLEIDHLCRVRHCVNPAHLRPVTPLENKRMIRGRNSNMGKTHCLNGHEFDAENTYVRPGGGRHCKACQRERSRRYEASRYRTRHLREEAS